MIDGVLGIDVSKNTIDVSMSVVATRYAPGASRIPLMDGAISLLG